jgi:hypothetical protein
MRNYIDLITEDKQNQKLIENFQHAGKLITEAQLTADQINQIFAGIEKNLTAAGGNRTAIGKGVDTAKSAAGAVGKAYNGLIDKFSNTKVMQGFDAAYDKAAEQLKQATGGDQGAMQYVQKYRDFAKKHPIAQSAIYALLIAAVSIGSGGAAAPAALGLLKMGDRLLQGDKFSQALAKGATTGAMAAVGQGIKGALSGQDVPSTGIKKSSAISGYTKSDLDRAVKFAHDATDADPGTSGTAKAIQAAQSSTLSKQDMMNDFAKKMGLTGDSHKAVFKGGVPVEIDGKPVPQNLYTPDQANNVAAAKKMAAQMANPTAADTSSYSKVDNTPGVSIDAKDKLSQAMGNGPAKGLNAKFSGGGGYYDAGEKFFNPELKSVSNPLGLDPSNPPKGIKVNTGSDGTTYFTKDSQTVGTIAPKAVRSGAATSAATFESQAIQAATYNFEWIALPATLMIDYKRSYQPDYLGESAAISGTVLTREGINCVFSNLERLHSHLLEYGTEDEYGQETPQPQKQGIFGKLGAGIKKAAGAVAGSKLGQAVGKGVQAVKTAATNATTQVTADKLNKAWSAAGSPMDTKALTGFLTQQGVDKSVIAATFKSLGIPLQSGGRVAGQGLSQTANAQRQRAARAAKKAAPGTVPTAEPGVAVQQAQPAGQPQAQFGQQWTAQAKPMAKPQAPQPMNTAGKATANFGAVGGQTAAKTAAKPKKIKKVAEGVSLRLEV